MSQVTDRTSIRRGLPPPAKHCIMRRFLHYYTFDARLPEQVQKQCRQSLALPPRRYRISLSSPRRWPSSPP